MSSNLFLLFFLRPGSVERNKRSPKKGFPTDKKWIEEDFRWIDEDDKERVLFGEGEVELAHFVYSGREFILIHSSFSLKKGQKQKEGKYIILLTRSRKGHPTSTFHWHHKVYDQRDSFVFVKSPYLSIVVVIDKGKSPWKSFTADTFFLYNWVCLSHLYYINRRALIRIPGVWSLSF